MSKYEVLSYVEPGKVPKKSVVHCHGFTVHATQGETVKAPRKVILCMERVMEPRVLYTAVTRCETMSQLFFYDGRVHVGGEDGASESEDAFDQGVDSSDGDDENDAILDEVDMEVDSARRRAWVATGAVAQAPRKRQRVPRPIVAPKGNRLITDFY
jgi:hypothetical protein